MRRRKNMRVGQEKHSLYMIIISIIFK
jgi:carbohydrate ABC transporter substrate-binding protein, CUT1 family (TC 3.A.1.1.-)